MLRKHWLRKHFPHVAVLLGALMLLVPLPVPAQKADKVASGLDIGTAHIDFGKSSWKSGQARFWAGVKMTSDQYDLTAEEVLATPAPAKGGHSGLTKAMAAGSPAKKTQVVAHVRQPLEGKDVEIFADRAVYVPEPARPGGGRIDFTGHVTVIGMSGFLAGPAPGDFGAGPVTVLLGQGDDYPQLETGPGHIVVTPAQ